MAKHVRSIVALAVVLSLPSLDLGQAVGATKPKATARKPPRSLAGFCKASKTWVAWETATLGASGHLNEQWVTDTLNLVRPVVDTAPKDIYSAALRTLHELVVSRRILVESVVGPIDVPNQVGDLIATGEMFASDPKFIAARDKFAAYMLAKCKIDYTAPFKAVAAG